jgi:peptide/nickel transport system substrate-binding protein
MPLVPKSRRHLLGAGTLAALVVFATACDAHSPTTSGASTAADASTLRIAFSDDMGVPDPDTFYASEGLMVTNSVYEGLLQYADNSTRIVGDVAQLPTVSADKLVYTFQLHPGITFHDGTPLNSEAVAASFARRTAIAQGPSYMLAQVKSVATPGPTTVVVTLKKPVSAFLDYLASPFGPKMTSPTAIKQHAQGDDRGQKWLATHDAGSGPYQISDFVPNQKYVLTRYAGYWGSRPSFPTVDISIQPSTTTQELELEKGQLDMITHGLPSQDIASLAKRSGLAVHRYPTELKTMLFLNSHTGAFTSAKSREALERALDKSALTTQVFGAAGTASTQIYPAGELPASATTSTVRYDPSVLKALVPSLPTKTVDIGYDSTDPRNQQMAEFVQLALQNVGLNASTRAIPIAQIFSLSTHLKQAPTILIQTTNPDAAHPDTWARIYMSSAGGANYLQCANPAVDRALDTGLAASTPAAVEAAYGEAGNLVVKDGCFIDISDVKDTIVTRAGLSGLHHVPSMPWGFDLAEIKG